MRRGRARERPALHRRGDHDRRAATTTTPTTTARARTGPGRRRRRRRPRRRPQRLEQRPRRRRRRLRRNRMTKTILLAAATGAAVIAAAVPALAAPSAQTVRVSERDYRIGLSPAPRAGRVTFVVRNTGDDGHDFRVSGGGVSKRSPMLAPGRQRPADDDAQEGRPLPVLVRGRLAREEGHERQLRRALAQRTRRGGPGLPLPPGRPLRCRDAHTAVESGCRGAPRTPDGAARRGRGGDHHAPRRGARTRGLRHGRRRDGRRGARAATRELEPDLVLLDVMLPDGSGFDVCRELRRDVARCRSSWSRPAATRPTGSSASSSAPTTT